MARERIEPCRGLPGDHIRMLGSYGRVWNSIPSCAPSPASRICCQIQAAPPTVAETCHVCEGPIDGHLPDGTPVCSAHNRLLVREANAAGARVLRNTEVRQRKTPDQDLMEGQTHANVTVRGEAGRPE